MKLTGYTNSYRTASWAMLLVMLGFMLMKLFPLPESFEWIYRIVVISIIIKNTRNWNIDKISQAIILLFISWLIINCIVGASRAEGYWAWKNVINQFLIALFYLTIILVTNIELIADYLALYWRYALLLLIVATILYGSPTLLNYVPFAVLMLFIAAIPKKRRWYLIALMALFFIKNDQRNDLIKIMLVMLTGFSLLYFRIPKLFFRTASLIFLIAPLVLLLLAVSGKFNVFEMDDYIEGDYTQSITTSEGVEIDNLKVDTRTFLYRNVFATLNKYDAWVFGRSPALTDEGEDDFWGTNEKTGVVGRYGNEVGILDILLWYGIVGVALYFLLFVRASYLAVFKSRNKYARAIGVYTSFLWLWSFVWEKPLFETFFMMDLVALGLCFSIPFRQMDNEEVKDWISRIFISSKKRQLIYPNESSLDI